MIWKRPASGNIPHRPSEHLPLLLDGKHVRATSLLVNRARWEKIDGKLVCVERSSTYEHR